MRRAEYWKAHRRDEELRAVSTRASVSHREQEGLRVLEGEVLVSELRAVDGLAASAVAALEIAALEHERRDHAVECGALVVQRFVALANALQEDEVSGYWVRGTVVHG